MNIPNSNVIIMDEEYENNASLIIPIFFEIVFKNYRTIGEIRKLEVELTSNNIQSKTIPQFINVLIDQIKQLKISPNIVKEIFRNFEAWLIEQDAIGKSYDRSNFEIKYWPNPDKDKRSIYQTLPVNKTNKILNKRTRIGSIGSCFATEIKKWLINNEFNYIQTENSIHSCANWGPKFNVPSIRLLLEQHLLDRKIPDFLMRLNKDNKLRYQYPFREEVFFDSIEEYFHEKSTHHINAKKALENLDVLILTLGLTEIWELSSDPDIVFSRSPWNSSPSLCKRKVLNVEDNITELHQINDILKLYNPNIQLIISVSPIPLLATFQTDDLHVVEATHLSKSTLKLAVNEFVKVNNNATYFPSYETITYCTKNPWKSDQRHVNSNAVCNVMKLFQQIFVR